MNQYHIAFGVYGIFIQKESLLVIRKNGGPYIHRFDLPGGSLEDGESLTNALMREVKEETGLQVQTFNQLGTINFLYAWSYEETSMNNHICVFYQISAWSGNILKETDNFDGQDSLGALWVPFEEINLSNSSLLVLKAKEFYQKKKFIVADQYLSDWKIKDNN